MHNPNILVSLLREISCICMQTTPLIETYTYRGVRGAVFKDNTLSSNQIYDKEVL